MNEYTGFSNITRNVLKPLQPSGIIGKDLERKRREDNYDYDGRRAAYLRGSSAHPQGIGIYNQDQIEDRRIGGNENRRPVAHYQGCSQRLHQSPQETQEQINKATVGWQTTIEKFSAIQVASESFGERRDNLRDPCTIFSIHSPLPYDKVCIRGMSTQQIERGCAHE